MSLPSPGDTGILMGGHIAVLVNPKSGKGRGADAAAVAIAHLRARGASLRVSAGGSLIEARRLASEALAAHPDVLVVVGGDGTLSGILDLVYEAGIPVALVPAGTGNDFARALALPHHDPRAAADLAMDGRPRAVDVGEITSGGGIRLFLTVAALGFDAKVSDRTNRLRWPPGKARYYLALLIELVRLRPTVFRLAIDEGAESDAAGTLIAVGNTDSYGGGMPICRDAAPDDGLVDVVRVLPLGRLRLLWLFPRLLRGTHMHLPQVEQRRARRVVVSAPDLVVYADGERLGQKECTISIRSRALTVLVPKESDDD